MYYFLNYFLTNYGASNSKNTFLFSESTADWRHHVAMFRNRIRRKDIKKLRCIKIQFDILFIYLFTLHQNLIWYIFIYLYIYLRCIKIPFDILFISLRCIKIPFDILFISLRCIKIPFDIIFVYLRCIKITFRYIIYLFIGHVVA
jgi:hypothetical protein